MKLSELQSHLSRIEADHGDVDVTLCDADTGWYFKFTEDHIWIQLANGTPRVAIGCDYGNERDSDPDNELPPY